MESIKVKPHTPRTHTRTHTHTHTHTHDHIVAFLTLTQSVTWAGVGQSVQCLITTDWQMGSNPWQRQRMSPLVSVSRPTLKPTQPPEQWVPSPRIKCGQGVTLTTHPHSVLRSRMSRSYISSLPWCLNCVTGQLCFTLFSQLCQTYCNGRTVLISWIYGHFQCEKCVG
jgi:hypothetical protein